MMNEALIRMYATAVKTGRLDITSVPNIYKDSVLKILESDKE